MDTIHFKNMFNIKRRYPRSLQIRLPFNFVFALSIERRFEAIKKFAGILKKRVKTNFSRFPPDPAEMITFRQFIDPDFYRKSTNSVEVAARRFILKYVFPELIFRW